MSVEKGQKYKHEISGNEYTILSEPFETPKGGLWVAYWDHTLEKMFHVIVDSWENGLYTLIREPKFKVGDRVTFYNDTYSVVAVSEAPDKDGYFGYLTLDPKGYFQSFDDTCDIKAAS